MPKRPYIQKHELFTPDNKKQLGNVEIYGDVLLIYLCWSTDYYEITKSSFNDAVKHSVPEQQLSAINNVIVYAWPDELCDIDSLLMLESKVTESFGDIPKIILYNNNAKNPETFEYILKNQENLVWLGVNFFAFKCYYLYRRHSLTWNPNMTKVLWLVGNANRVERLIPFYLMAESGLLKRHFTYSFKPDYCSKEIPEDHFKKVSDIFHAASLQHKDLSEFLSESTPDFNYLWWSNLYARDLDIELGNYQYDGTVSDFSLYHQTCAEFVIESRYDIPWFRTEKTYRAYALGFPVLILGTHFQNRLIQDGYRSFEKYLDWDSEYPDWFPYATDDQNHVTETNKMMEAVPKFIERCKRPHIQEQIRADIAHNKQALRDHVIESIKPAEELIPDISEIFYQNIHHNKN